MSQTDVPGFLSILVFPFPSDKWSSHPANRRLEDEAETERIGIGDLYYPPWN